jgi:hypothetical protein
MPKAKYSAHTVAIIPETEKAVPPPTATHLITDPRPLKFAELQKKKLLYKNVMQVKIVPIAHVTKHIKQTDELRSPHDVTQVMLIQKDKKDSKAGDDHFNSFLPHDALRLMKADDSGEEHSG